MNKALWLQIFLVSLLLAISNACPSSFHSPHLFFFATLRVCVSIYIFIYFKDLYIYLKDRVTETEGMAHIQRERESVCSICWFSTKMTGLGLEQGKAKSHRLYPGLPCGWWEPMLSQVRCQKAGLKIECLRLQSVFMYDATVPDGFSLTC